MALPQPFQRVQLARRVPLAAPPQSLHSAWAIRVATSSLFDRDSTAARFVLLPRETSPQFFANAPAPCSAASTVKISPSARSNLPAPAIAGPLHFQGKPLREPAAHERAHYGPASVCPISSAGYRSVSPGLHRLYRAALPPALPSDSRTH